MENMSADVRMQRVDEFFKLKLLAIPFSQLSLSGGEKSERPNINQVEKKIENKPCMKIF